MADLVSHHRRELIHTIGTFRDAAIDVDVAAGKRERVEVVRVHQEEVPVEVASIGHMGQRITEHLEVPVDLRVADDRKLRVHLLGLLGADLAPPVAVRSRRPTILSPPRPLQPHQIVSLFAFPSG